VRATHRERGFSFIHEIHVVCVPLRQLVSISIKYHKVHSLCVQLLFLFSRSARSHTEVDTKSRSFLKTFLMRTGEGGREAGKFYGWLWWVSIIHNDTHKVFF
jgi:hypothetical protein